MRLRFRIFAGLFALTSIAAAQAIVVSQTTVSFRTRGGSVVGDPQTLTLALNPPPPGECPGQLTMARNDLWILLTPPVATTFGVCTPVRVSVEPRLFSSTVRAPATLNGLFSITAPGAIGARVAVNVDLLAPPAVRFNTPTSGTAHTGTITLTVTPTVDTRLTLRSVTIALDNQLICTLTSAPFQCTLNTTRSPNGQHVLTATVRDELDGMSRATVTVQFNNAAAPPPGATPQSVTLTNAASGSDHDIAPGSLVTLYGESLLAAEGAASTVPLPTRIGDTEWLIDDTPLQLGFWSAGQINGLVPPSTKTTAPVRISKRVYPVSGPYQQTDFYQLGLKPQAPGIFLMPRDCTLLHAGDCPEAERVARGAITDQTGKLITRENPAALNQPLTIWLTGLGKSKMTPEGYAVAEAPPFVWILRSSARVGGADVLMPFVDQPLMVLFGGPAPGYPGLDQINFLVPPDQAKSRCGIAMQLEMDLEIRTGTPIVRSNLVKLPIAIKPTDVPCFQ